MVPGLIILMLVLLGYAITSGDFARGVSFLFQPDFDRTPIECGKRSHRHGFGKASRKLANDVLFPNIEEQSPNAFLFCLGK